MSTADTGDRPLLSTAEALAVVQAMGTKRRRRRTLLVGTPVVLATVCVIAIGAFVVGSRRDVAHRPTSTSVPHHLTVLGKTAEIVYTVPNNTPGPPWALTGGAGNSVWYWTAGDDVIYHVSGVTHSERAYRLGAGCCGGGVRAYTGLTVAPNGTVWGVLNHTLIELNPVSGHFSLTTLPNAPAAKGEPSMDLAMGQDSADLVTVSPDGKQLVVGFADAAAIAVYQLADNSPSVHPAMIHLPVGYIALDIGVSADGTIGVGMERFGSNAQPEVDLIRPGGGSTQVRVLDGWGMVADGTGFLVGEYRPEFVTAAGEARRVPADFTLPPGGQWAQNAEGGGPNRLTLLPHGLIARPIDHGLVEVASPARSVLFETPRQRYRNLPIECGGCLQQSTTTTTLVPPPKWIWQRDGVQQIVSDGDGDVWILTETPSSNTAFAEITAAQVRSEFG